MKITAFHIKNYRSIVDSGLCYLSPDNITSLIGQNESGKTSVLEALRSFYEGSITDDVLRSDQTFPEITCTFSFEEEEHFADMIDLKCIPPDLHEALIQKKEISLQRRWFNSRNNDILLCETEILSYLLNAEQAKKQSDEKIRKTLPELIIQLEAATRALEFSENAVMDFRKELNSLQKNHNEMARLFTRAKQPADKISAEERIKISQKKLEDAEAEFKHRLSRCESEQKILQSTAEKINVCKQYNDAADRLKFLENERVSIDKKLLDVEHLFDLSESAKRKKQFKKILLQLRQANDQTILELQEQQDQLDIVRRTLDGLLSDKPLKESEIKAIKDFEMEKSYNTAEELGKKLFGYIPVFEFFEDFSSLLPNKIDLEDLLNENSAAEGYKAARNFLAVAGLNADFFHEKNHRILKQKIENLNGEITVDFQDYWRQNVGRNDKIRIHFELEHYDYTQPEKSGKPYLEFWIKDKQERLYPKQRSRGVRWFLSFYLELKATAKKNTRNRIMLIDEPGLSLHARAQEDVLKVFEDLREHLQIIYCTHSPNLIDVQKLFRIIAVQRAKEGDEASETVILDARSLHEASSDTLLPIYSLMGTRLNDRQFIFPRNNIIVEDTVTFYYLDIMSRLFGMSDAVHFIPATGSESIPMLANILYGWKIDFCLLVMDTPQNKKIADFIQETTFFRNKSTSQRKIRSMTGFSGIEDLFSTIDFKRFILAQRVGITVKNTEYIENNNLSQLMLASDFTIKIQKENISMKDFDDETRTNFEYLFFTINEMLAPETLVTPDPTR
jgi:predicted ATP-dependent endonuclease of OLD family